jgi:hypothetical protein
MPLVFLVFLLLVLVVLVVSGRGMGASRLTAGPRAREPSLRYACLGPGGLCPLARWPLTYGEAESLDLNTSRFVCFTVF